MKEFIHIGCPKTASTTLQNSLFARHPEIASIGKPYESREGEVAKQLYGLITKDDFELERCQQALSEEKKRKESTGKVVVLSEEKIYVSPNFEEAGRRLRALFPTAKILITVRNQFDLVTSWYCQGNYDGRYWRWAGIPNPYGNSFVSFDQFLDFTFSNSDKNVSEVFHFYKKAMVFADLFGRENVFVLPIEKLKSNPRLFTRDLSGILGINNESTFDLLNGKVENQRNTGNISMYRFNSRIAPLKKIPALGNLLTSAPFERLTTKLIYKFAQHKVTLSEEWRRNLTELYREENRKLADEFNLELLDYGYPLATS